MKMIVVSLVLATIIACNSVKKSKSSYKEVIADKRTEQSSSLTASHKDSTLTTKETKDVSTKLYSNVLGIEYTPIFDQVGNLIPFHYDKEDSNGNVTKVNIVGPGKVINTITNKDERIVSEILAERRIRWQKVDSILNDLQVQVDTTVEKVESTKTVAPDYLKYIIWMGFSITVLAIIIVLIIAYFRIQIKNIKKLLP